MAGAESKMESEKVWAYKEEVTITVTVAKTGTRKYRR